MSHQWYLLKVKDNEVFGPTPLGQLQIWAAGAKISPVDRVSNDDQKTWVRAAMVPELQMDWLIEMPDNYLYGPTNIGTLQEFLAVGEIDENVTVINTREGLQSRIGELPFFKASPHRVRGNQDIMAVDGDNLSPDATGVSRQKVAFLEKRVMELEREALRWEEACASLRSQYIEATGREPL